MATSSPLGLAVPPAPRGQKSCPMDGRFSGGHVAGVRGHMLRGGRQHRQLSGIACQGDPELLVMFWALFC